MNETINIEAGDMGMVVAFVLMLGGVIKNYTPVKNELIPLITWILGGLLYQWLAGGWTDPRQWMMALISVAGATGLHSATRSTVGAVKGSDVPMILLTGFLAFGVMTTFTGCTTPQTREAIVFNTFKDTWTVAHAAYQAHCENVVTGKVSKEKEIKVDREWNRFRLAFKTALSVANQDWTQMPPASLDVAEQQLINLIRNL